MQIMNILINNRKIEIIEGETLIETAKRMGVDIPFLCYFQGFKHKSSCMVCVVKNLTDGQIMPSCTTFPEEGMVIDTECEEVRAIRIMSLELLLSDHRADCEAPCSLVCPFGLDVERVFEYYDTGRMDDAYLLILKAFSSPESACRDCKAPCEKACRRGTVDKAVTIKDIITQIAGMTEIKIPVGCEPFNTSKIKESNKLFQSRLGRFTPIEKERLKATVTTASRCLHCACAGRKDCKLRLYATIYGVKRPCFETSSALPAMVKQLVNETIWFEPAKCIRCGLCVFNSANGFTFKDRGFGMSVVLPDENRKNINNELTALCPTGALYTQLK